jgi:hypothetical protein
VHHFTIKEEQTMRRYLAAGLVTAFVVTAGVVLAEPGWGPGAGDCNGCGKGPAQGMEGGGRRMYDPAKSEVMTGQVVSVEQHEARRGPGRGVVLTVNIGNDTLPVVLGPQWFIDEQKMKLVAGDTVEIKGVKASRRGRDIFIAAEIKKGQEVMTLRDENGRPAWAGSRQGEKRS